MKAVLRLLVYLPLGAILLLFAMANRKMTPVWIDPFAGGETQSPAAFEAPLFVIVFVAMAIGVLAGGFASWSAHRSVRRAAKLARADAERARAEVEKLRSLASASAGIDATAKR